jgi:hypothetical protein
MLPSQKRFLVQDSDSFAVYVAFSLASGMDGTNATMLSKSYLLAAVAAGVDDNTSDHSCIAFVVPASAKTVCNGLGRP